MVRLTREQSQAQTRERLLDAAAKVFGERGFAAASLDDISMRLRGVAPLIAAAILLAGCSSNGQHAAMVRTAATTSTTTPPTRDCTPALPAPRTTAPLHLSFRGTDRTYLLAVPHAYDGRRAFPLVLSLAGFGGTPVAHEANTAIGREGAARGFLVVTPASLGNPPQWNIFGAKDKADDYAFIDALVAQLERRLCVDAARVYVAGYSNGSAFAGFLACAAPYRFAAVAMVEATTPAACQRGITPSVLAIAGTADPAVLFNGGTGASHQAIPPAPRTIANYASRYHCDAVPSTTLPVAGVTRTRYAHCDPDRTGEVVLDAVEGGTHDYPGGLVASHDKTDSPAGRTFSATNEILAFFARHRSGWGAT